jgi:hypothetical protein
VESAQQPKKGTITKQKPQNTSTTSINVFLNETGTKMREKLM